ncbi:MAG: ABC transporter permease [Bacilli bacterium]
MSKIWIVFKKELTRFFKDTRLFFSTVILPGLLLFIIYNVIGEGMEAMFKPKDDYVAEVYAVNYPDGVKTLLESEEAGLKTEVEEVEVSEITHYQELIKEKEVDLLMVFEEGFDEKYNAVVAEIEGAEAPYVKLYYNSTKPESEIIYHQVSAMITSLEAIHYPDIIKLNDDLEEVYDQATERDIAGMIFATMYPFMILTFITTGVIGLATENIAGEKERGTLATVLVTPIKRGEYAVGKVLAIAFESLLSGLSSFIAVMLSLPQMTGMSGGMANAFQNFAPLDFIWILLIIIALVLFVGTLISIVSAFARTVKEASSYSAPLMMVLMVLGITSMLTQGNAATNALIYLIPIIGPLQALVGIFSFNSQPLLILIAFLSSLVYAFGLGFILVKMFNNEKVIFNK